MSFEIEIPELKRTLKGKDYPMSEEEIYHSCRLGVFSVQKGMKEMERRGLARQDQNGNWIEVTKADRRQKANN